MTAAERIKFSSDKSTPENTEYEERHRVTYLEKIDHSKQRRPKRMTKMQLLNLYKETDNDEGKFGMLECHEIETKGIRSEV
jgi:hypothetical protein